jgi:beta-phosphoglucomutase-like phosphatase (HAD superfamily)
VIAAGDIVPAKKPAPDIYEWALQKLKLPPGQCIAFEDSRNGLKSSTSAGIKTVITINDYTAQENFDGALAVLSDLGEPQAPCKVIAGQPCDRPYVDVALVRKWAGNA